MKVFLTGANGFLGRAVRKALLHEGKDVVATARTISDGTAADLEDSAAVLKLLKEVKPGAIINCAARVDFGTNVGPILYSVNTLLPAVLGEWCRRNNAYLVQPSSISVHGVRAQDIGPDTPIQADTDYGRSKWLAEVNVQQAGCRAAILRFSGLFGSTGPDHLSLNRAIRGAQAGKVPMVVGEGSAKRNYLFVQDAAAIIAHCVDKGIQGLYWAGGRQVLTVRQMLEAICEVYLPGSKPQRSEGSEAADQIVRNSPDLPIGQTFREALEHERGV